MGQGDLSDEGHVEGVREDDGVNCSQTGHRLLWEGWIQTLPLPADRRIGGLWGWGTADGIWGG